MTYEKLRAVAEGMTEAEVADGLKGLAADPRFGAVLKIILEQKELAADYSCDLKFSNCHGALAHAAGVRWGMRELEGKIRVALEPAKRRGAQAPAEGKTHER